MEDLISTVAELSVQVKVIQDEVMKLRQRQDDYDELLCEKVKMETKDGRHQSLYCSPSLPPPKKIGHGLSDAQESTRTVQ